MAIKNKIPRRRKALTTDLACSRVTDPVPSSPRLKRLTVYGSPRSGSLCPVDRLNLYYAGLSAVRLCRRAAPLRSLAEPAFGLCLRCSTPPRALRLRIIQHKDGPLRDARKRSMFGRQSPNVASRRGQAAPIRRGP